LITDFPIDIAGDERVPRTPSGHGEDFTIIVIAFVRGIPFEAVILFGSVSFNRLR
jgi:hypothetical protein